MEFTPETKLSEILNAYPELKEKLPKLDPRLEIVGTLAGRLLLGNYTIAGASEKTGIPAETLIARLKELLGLG